MAAAASEGSSECVGVNRVRGCGECGAPQGECKASTASAERCMLDVGQAQRLSLPFTPWPSENPPPPSQQPPRPFVGFRTVGTS
eukprot:362749-Chlamydomonas_euryale.AAC.3